MFHMFCARLVIAFIYSAHDVKTMNSALQLFNQKCLLTIGLLVFKCFICFARD